MSHELLIAAVESLVDRLVILAPERNSEGHLVDFVLLYANSSALNAVGLRREGCLGRKLSEVFPGYGDGGFFDLYEEVLRTGKPAGRDGLLYQAPSGPLISGRWLDVRATLSGTNVVVTWREATQRKLAEERMQLAQQVAGVGTFEWNLHTGKTAVSPEWEALYGLAPGSYQGGYDDWAKFVHPEDLPKVAASLTRDFDETGNTILREVEFRILRTDGALRWLSSRGIIYRDGKGKPYHLLGTSWDITDYKRVEAALRTNAEEMGRFAFIASHDLKEPLRVIANYARILHDTYHHSLDDRAKEYLGFMSQAAKRMQGLIDDLLAYANIGKLEKSRCHAADAVADALKNLDAAVKDTDAVVEVGELPHVVADRGQLTRLFQNLISNAIKFRSAEPPRIRLSASRSGEEWIFTIADNGIGIPEAQFQRIFDLFHRLHSAKEYPGTGIGLAICKKIVEAHGGRIWPESRVSKGSSFHFGLPAV